LLFGDSLGPSATPTEHHLDVLSKPMLCCLLVPVASRRQTNKTNVKLGTGSGFRRSIAGARLASNKYMHRMSRPNQSRCHVQVKLDSRVRSSCQPLGLRAGSFPCRATIEFFPIAPTERVSTGTATRRSTGAGACACAEARVGDAPAARSRGPTADHVPNI
jgi:hypothetical protein